MIFIQIIMIGFGLSADAFAVSVTNGMSIINTLPTRREMFKIAFIFGIFQALMPLLGFLLGMVFVEFVESFSHWIAFIFLSFIGGRMVWEVEKKDENSIPENVPETVSFKLLLMQGVATSIDALVAGVSFIAMGLRGVQIVPAVAIIGMITFVMSFLGVNLGLRVGGYMGAVTAKIAGGLILIVMGLIILFEGLFDKI
ncbi:MAG: manganese efflux pump MntP family protein [Oscillospiraceae bacterium]|nr:manganese efflux pump MntP family protein [Oscillospiraceae bacterium]